MSLDAIAARFAASFRERLDGPRRLGREAEYPVVDAAGHALDVRPVLEDLAAFPGSRAVREGELVVAVERPGWTCALEVGWGTVEVITGPVDDLGALARRHEDALGELLAVVHRHGGRLLGLGAQPRTPPGSALMSPKARYRVLRRAIGPGWDAFTVTASDQLHVDVARDELVPLTNLLNLASPVVVALCANSPLVGGHPSGWACAREALMGRIGAGQGRHGMPVGPAADIPDWVARLATMPVFARRADPWRPEGRSFEALVAAGEGGFETFLDHEHYIWNSARPRTAHSTLELRAACQQPLDTHLAAAALGLGLVEGAPAVAARLSRLPDAWPTMRAWRAEVVREGLRAPPPQVDLLEDLLVAAAEGLERRGRGEAAWLDPLWDRLRERTSPAHHALELAGRGWKALVAGRGAA